MSIVWVWRGEWLSVQSWNGIERTRTIADYHIRERGMHYSKTEYTTQQINRQQNKRRTTKMVIERGGGNEKCVNGRRKLPYKGILIALSQPSIDHSLDTIHETRQEIYPSVRLLNWWDSQMGWSKYLIFGAENWDGSTNYTGGNYCVAAPLISSQDGRTGRKGKQLNENEIPCTA